MESEANQMSMPRGGPSARLATKLPISSYQGGESTSSEAQLSQTGLLIVNADDWGRDYETTERISECLVRGTVSSVSAMVFMDDSERAAAKVRERGIDAGLHLNFTTPFSAQICSRQLLERQGRLSAYLQRHPLARVVFNPWLVRDFEYVVAVQLDEFRRLYGIEPNRLDGHHHMHLCSNVLRAQLLPSGTIVRRNFSFQPGEKSPINRLYRKAMDRRLAQRHQLVDFLFSLTPLEPESRLMRIFSLVCRSVIELETHPINPEEYQLLKGDTLFKWLGQQPSTFRFAAIRLGPLGKKALL
jgi:chitin disaccharide deacetylase